MRRSKAKNFGPPPPSQKVITEFFTKKPLSVTTASNNNETNGASSSSSSCLNNGSTAGPTNKSIPRQTARKRTTTMLPKIGKQLPGKGGPIEVVDLVDSDDEVSMNENVQVPAWVIPQKYTGIKIEGEIVHVSHNDGDDGGDEDPFLRPALQVDSNEEDDNDTTCTPNKIRIVDFNNILENSQCSEEDDTQELQLNCNNEDELTQAINSEYHIVDTCNSNINNSNSILPSLTPTKKNVWEIISPTKVPSSSSNPKRKQPTQSAKAKVTHFSPIKQLNRSRSRSSSKTPTKRTQSASSQRPSSSSQQQDGRNHNTKSPLKALWATARPSPLIPYYLNNFLTVLNTVADDSHNAHLFNEEDREIITKFRKLSNSAQCLFVRLTNRKFKWEKASTVKYPAIAEDLSSVFQELHSNKFLIEISEEQMELDEVLSILSQTNLDDLCTKLHISLAKGGRTKEKCKAALLKSAENQMTLQGKMSDIIHKSALKEIGPTYKIAPGPRNLFSRCFILYSPPQYWDQEADQGSNQQLSFLLTEVGQVEYPKYKIIKSKRIYGKREDILEFQEAWTLHSDIQAYAESKQWQECCEVAEEAMFKLVALLKKPDTKEHDLKLPLFLRAYVAGSLLVRICWLGVDGLQKVKNYDKANKYINFLLEQDSYLPHYRGQFYERLVINSRHLKVPQATVRKIILHALSDKHTRDSHKLDLTARLGKLKPDKPKPKPKPKRKAKKKKPKPKKRVTRNTKNLENSESEESSSTESSSSSSSSESDDDSDIESVEIFNVEGFQSFQIKNNLPETVIEGEKLPMFDREYGKSRFRGDADGGTPTSSVEEFALRYYQTKGYNYGVHAEGAVAATIYGLLFWNLIYDEEVPDAFHSPFQAFPLDLFFDDFREQRRLKIEERLNSLRFSCSHDDILDIMEVNWTENRNKVSIVNWDIFPSFEQLRVLVQSMRLPLIAGICDRLSQNFRYYRSGFPDLVVWNGKTCLFAEVKGPGDTLSAKQRLWLDFLISLDAATELCKVKSVSSKRIRMS